MTQHRLNVSRLLGNLYGSAPNVLLQVTIYRKLRIGRDGHLANPKPTIYRNLQEKEGPGPLFSIIYDI